ncbi:hypothetical protein [Nocardioides solisilvae]|uniref:hypothetical protein n=1 Tax=Nocardioides solisilvae TaxID=1542435 RepID=UPI000D743E18|nr:hypothetical protein [Nocardioides solisilvae]
MLSSKDVVMAVASGATVLVDPRRLSPRLRRGYRVGLTALATGAGYHALGQQDARGDAEALPPAGRAAVAAAIGGVVYGSVRGGERMDAASTDWLTRRGVKHPRVVLAVAGTVLTLGMSAVEKWQEQHAEQQAGQQGETAEPEVTPPA